MSQNDDCISRQAAIEDAREAFKRNPTMAIRVMDLIKSMPSAQPEQKKGKWIEIMDADEFGNPYPCGVRCSECGFCSVNLDNYCPNCGSYNGGEQE